jgi:hypothetical protein
MIMLCLLLEDREECLVVYKIQHVISRHADLLTMTSILSFITRSLSARLFTSWTYVYVCVCLQIKSTRERERSFFLLLSLSSSLDHLSSGSFQ